MFSLFATNNFESNPGRGSSSWSKLTLFSGLCVGWLGLAEPASAQWLKLDAFRRSPAAKSSEVSPTNSCVESIRKLKREARQAADRGDLVAARRAAEQAHQYALNYRSSITEFPDCSPEVTAELLRQFAYSSTMAPLESVTAQQNADELARSLTQLSDESPIAPPVSGFSKPKSREPRLLPGQETIAQLPVKKASASGKKKSRRLAAPRPIPTTASPAEEALAQRPEPRYEYFQPAIQKPAPGSGTFLVEEEQYTALESKQAGATKTEETVPESFPVQESATETPSQEQPVPTETTPRTPDVILESEIITDEATPPPAVTNAIGEAETARSEPDASNEGESETKWPDWLDSESAATDTPAEAAPVSEAVEPAAEIAPPAAEEAAPRIEVQTAPTLPHADADAIDADSEFFSTPEPEASAPVEPADETEMAHVTYTTAEPSLPPAPRIPAPLDAVPQELSPPKNVQPAKPSVTYGDGVAVSWTLVRDDFEDPASRARPSAWRQFEWDSLDLEEKIAVIGGVMLLCGMVLFIVSTRRSPGPA